MADETQGIKIGDMTYQFPVDMSDADIKTALVKNGVIPTAFPDSKNKRNGLGMSPGETPRPAGPLDSTLLHSAMAVPGLVGGPAGPGVAALLSRLGIAGASSAATSAGQDVMNGQPVNPGDAGVAAIGGAGAQGLLGEMLPKVLGAFKTEAAKANHLKNLDDQIKQTALTAAEHNTALSTQTDQVAQHEKLVAAAKAAHDDTLKAAQQEAKKTIAQQKLEATTKISSLNENLLDLQKAFENIKSSGGNASALKEAQDNIDLVAKQLREAKRQGSLIPVKAVLQTPINPTSLPTHGPLQEALTNHQTALDALTHLKGKATGASDLIDLLKAQKNLAPKPALPDKSDLLKKLLYAGAAGAGAATIAKKTGLGNYFGFEK